MTSPPPAEESVDAVLGRLDAVIGRLAEAREPIEEQVLAYEEGLRLLAVAQARLKALGQDAGIG